MIMASETTNRAFDTASQQKTNTFIQGLETKLSKTMKNVKDWKSVLGENKMDHSWYVKKK
jgi:cytochrome c-type biogenesis protein CcmH/NrfG